MGPFRSVFGRYPLLALAIGAAAILLRLAVPAGFMPALDQGRMVLALCSGSAPALSASAHHGAATDSGPAGHGESAPRADKGCAFADLALPAIASADPVLPAAAFLFVMAAGLLAAAPLPTRAGLRLRPPLRGPPLRG